MFDSDRAKLPSRDLTTGDNGSNAKARPYSSGEQSPGEYSSHPKVSPLGSSREHEPSNLGHTPGEYPTSKS